MGKKILIGVVVAIALFLGYVALQPSDFKITRDISINASAETLFPYINNSRKSNEWMPWKESDPGVEMQYSGPEEGVGSTASWDSQGNMGKGKAVVIESSLNQTVKTHLTYERPMDMEQVAEVALTPEGNATKVTWTVTGKNSFMGRLFCVFMNMDKMVGGEFEKGLAKLKLITESTN